jgi:cysteine-rich secretory family protein
MPVHAASIGRTFLLLLVAPAIGGAASLQADFNSRILAAQNREREALGERPLEWDSNLAQSAQVWADYLARTGAFEHSPDRPDTPEGENLWAGTSGAYAPEQMVGLWLSEKNEFKRGVFPDNSRTGDVEDVGHYTQVIWAGTNRVGCALARGKAEDFLVCRYAQAGNVVGENPLDQRQIAIR